MRMLAIIITALAMLIGGDHPAHAGKRVALVIGNSAYRNVAALGNPVNDAAAIAGMFRQAKFDVVGLRDDLGNIEMRRALRDFSDQAQGADIAVIYYAGHGIEVGGTNYLIPVDATIERDTDAYDEAIALDRILQAVEPARQLRLVILDACRDNPFAKKMRRTMALRSLGRGLAGIEPTQPNTLVAYAAKGGSTAADGDGKNSPFAGALLKHLTTPGLDVRRAFGLVRDDVMAATDNHQEPFVYGSLGGEEVPLVPVAKPRAQAAADIRSDYELAEKVGTREAWDSFIKAYPTGFYADLAKAQRNKLDAEAARRVAADKARAAAEEEARLATEGASARTRAEAAARARMEADRQKQAEAAAAAAEADVKHVAEAKSAAEKAAAEPGSTAPENQKMASLPPAAEASRQAGSKPDADLSRLLQTELERVGCEVGEVDGVWGAGSQRALSAFNRHAGTRFDTDLASTAALDAVRGKRGRVCPLECGRGTHAVGGKCVATACRRGFERDDDGVCRPVGRVGRSRPSDRYDDPYERRRPRREAAPARSERAPVARHSPQIICDDHGCRPVRRGCRAAAATGPFQSQVCD